ncbi:MAG: hypothetical protein MHM6MM_001096 [Cercozoa sp. M6MM]
MQSHMFQSGEISLFSRAWLDVKDSTGKWLEAQVIKVDPDGTFVVHFKGWTSRWDCRLNVHSISDMQRVAPLHTHTGAKPVAHPLGFTSIEGIQRGLPVDACDTMGRWYRATVARTELVHGVPMLQVHYLGWGTRYDEWLRLDSCRLAQHLSMSEGATGPNYTDENRRVVSNDRPRAHSNDRPRDHPSDRRRDRPRDHPSELTSGPRVSSNSDSEQRYRELLQRQRAWHIVDMRGDGNCLFRAVSFLVYGDQAHHEVVRRSCVGYMRCESHFFRNYVDSDSEADFDTYCNAMERSGAWGGHVEIQALSELYQRPVHVFAYSTTPLHTFSAGLQAVTPLRLSYHCRSHYNAIHSPEDANDVRLQSTPGEYERTRIELVRAMRAPGAAADALQVSDREATEQTALAQALELSRHDLPTQQMAQIELAAQQSLQQFEQRQLELAREVSRQQYEQSQLEAALAQSMQGGDEDADLARALSASMQDAPPAEVEGSNELFDSSQVPPEVQQCLDLGFPLEACAEAFSLFGTDHAVAAEQRLANMVNFLLERAS